MLVVVGIRLVLGGLVLGVEGRQCGGCNYGKQVLHGAEFCRKRLALGEPNM
jgi:hypothetical protein